MGDPFDEVVGAVLSVLLAVAVLTAAFFFLSYIVIPVGLVGGGLLYWLHNIHLPEKRRREMRKRTEAMFARAERLAPSLKHLEEDLFAAEIFDPVLHEIARELYVSEGLTPPAMPPLSDDPIPLARYQDTLERFVNNAEPDHYRRFRERLVEVLRSHQSASMDGDGVFSSERTLSKREVERLILQFFDADNLFMGLRADLNANYQAERETMPTECRFDDYAWRYLKGTPLLPLASRRERIGLTDRMYHTYLLGSSGSGKTNLIENIIAHDLASSEDCCVVVIDSQTQLTEKLARLDIPETTYITPQYALALNLFDVGYQDMKGRGIAGETLINKTAGLLSFVMEGMMGAEFTNPQKTIFQYVIQLVISVPGANIFTFMDILADGGEQKYASAIAELDPNLQRFFTVDYPSGEYRRTRDAIRRKLDGLLLNPTFRRLFAASENKLDMFDELERQRLIIIDTNKPMLDEAASAFFGRLFIAMILRASHRRFESHGPKRPVYLVVDEAHEYFDKSVSEMLEQARKANIGLLLAHQSLSQSRGSKGGSLADSLMVNTATKIIWTSYREDAAKFAGSMQVKPEDILNLPQFTFGLHTRKGGFRSIRGRPNALADFPRRAGLRDLQHEMEMRYGPSQEVRSSDPPSAPEPDLRPDEPGSGSKPQGSETRQPKPGAPPDVEMI